jgi:hypothetical protein
MSKYRWLGAGLAGLALSACADDFVRFDDRLLLGSPAPEPQGSAGSVVSTGGGGSAGSTAGGGMAPTPMGGETSSGGSAPSPEAGAGGTDEGGAGGEAGAPNPVPSPVLDLIDEVEQGFPALPLRAGRNGVWFSVHDETGGFVEPLAAFGLTPARGTSHFAARLGGGGFTAWGAQLGVNLRSPGAGYDASSACSLRFVAKGRGEGWSVLVSDRLSSPYGGVCDLAASEPSHACYDHPGQSFTPGADWRTYDIRFAELHPFKGFSGSNRLLETGALFDIVFNFENPNGAAFELLVDDLAFVPCAEP